MKGGASHVIPMTSQVRAVLDNQVEFNGFYFAGITDHKPWTVNSEHMRALRPRLTILHFTLHDFRRYFSSTMARSARRSMSPKPFSIIGPALAAPSSASTTGTTVSANANRFGKIRSVSVVRLFGTTELLG